MSKRSKTTLPRRRKLAVRAQVAFAVTRNERGEPVALTLFAGRRALSRPLSPGMAAALAAHLSPSDQ